MEETLTLIHILKVLVKLSFSCLLVVFLLDDVSPVIDVVANGHLLYSTLGVSQSPPCFLNLHTQVFIFHTYELFWQI